MTTSIVGAIILIAVGILLIFAADRLPSPWRFLVYGVVIIIGLVWLLQATGLLAILLLGPRLPAPPLAFWPQRKTGHFRPALLRRTFGSACILPESAFCMPLPLPHLGQ